MSSLSKQQVKIIVTAIKKQAPRIRATPAWVQLSEEYGLGQMRSGHIHFSRQDYKAWRAILVNVCGFDPTQETLSGNRTNVASRTPNEKWSTESLLNTMVSTTALGGELVMAEGRCSIVPGIDYRVSVDSLRPDDYDALLVVENYEAFVFVHQFLLPLGGHVLVLYRGHDATARAVIGLLERAEGKPVIGFTDLDPAGVGILIDSNRFTHALIPQIDVLADAPTLTQRFAGQLAVRPRLKEQCEGRSKVFREYVRWVVDNGIAISQEWLCSHRVPLRLVSICEDKHLIVGDPQ